MLLLRAIDCRRDERCFFIAAVYKRFFVQQTFWHCNFGTPCCCSCCCCCVHACENFLCCHCCRCHCRSRRSSGCWHCLWLWFCFCFFSCCCLVTFPVWFNIELLQYCCYCCCCFPTSLSSMLSGERTSRCCLECWVGGRSFWSKKVEEELQ